MESYHETLFVFVAKLKKSALDAYVHAVVTLYYTPSRRCSITITCCRYTKTLITLSRLCHALTKISVLNLILVVNHTSSYWSPLLASTLVASM